VGTDIVITDEWGDRFLDGRELVGCDEEQCLAYKEPKTFEEYKAAYEHWRSHNYLCGCSHGR